MRQVALIFLLLSSTPVLSPAQAPIGARIICDSAADELVLIYGPVSLPPRSMPDTPVRVASIPVSGWIHGYRVELADGEGHVLPQRLIHHVNVIAPGRRELFSNIMLRVAAVGSETAPVELPALIGYPVRAGDSLLLSPMLHNPDSVAYAGVRLVVHLPFRAATSRLPSFRVYPFYVDVMAPAGSHSFDVPPGRSRRSWEGKPAVPGRILGLGGHLHRYGVELRFEDMTTGNVLFDRGPEVDANGEVRGVPVERYFWRLGLPVDTSHVYRLTATYDNPTGVPIEDGGMGALGGVFLPARGAVWPAANPTNAEYELDRKLAWRVDGMEGMVH